VRASGPQWSCDRASVVETVVQSRTTCRGLGLYRRTVLAFLVVARRADTRAESRIVHVPALGTSPPASGRRARARARGQPIESQTQMPTRSTGIGYRVLVSIAVDMGFGWQRAR
jgi:hypothetical protein